MGACREDGLGGETETLPRTKDGCASSSSQLLSYGVTPGCARVTGPLRLTLWQLGLREQLEKNPNGDPLATATAVSTASTEVPCPPGVPRSPAPSGSLCEPRRSNLPAGEQGDTSDPSSSSQAAAEFLKSRRAQYPGPATLRCHRVSTRHTAVQAMRARFPSTGSYWKSQPLNLSGLRQNNLYFGKQHKSSLELIHKHTADLQGPGGSKSSTTFL